MRQIRTAALSRHTAPAFVLLAGPELMQLRKLNDFAFRLFLELLAMADFTTGHVWTTYPVLVALLDFDRTPKAHAVPKPTQQRLRTALQSLIDLDLVKDMDRQRNERAGGLFFRVNGRGRISASNGMSNTMSNTHKKPAKQATVRVAEHRTLDEQHDEHTRVQKRDIPPKSPSLSTAPGPSRYVLESRAIVAAAKARRTGATP